MPKTDIHVALEGETDPTAILQKVFRALAQAHAGIALMSEFVADQPFGDERTEAGALELAALYVHVD